MDTAVNIIVIDTDEEAQRIVVREGKKKNYDVQAYNTPDGGLLGVLQNNHIDLLFIQYALSEGKGYDISRIAYDKNISVIVQDFDVTREKVTHAVRSGAIDFLVKPIKEKPLRDKIENVLVSRGKLPPKPKGPEQIVFGGKKLDPLEKIGIITDKAQEVMALPYAVASVIGLCNDPKTSASDIEKPLASDPALSAAVLKRSNSVIYTGVDKVKKLKDAVTRIGVRETKNICVAHSVFNMFDKNDKSFGFSRFGYWVHCLATGVIAQWAAKKLNFSPPEDALLAGLLHDIGKMVLDDYLNEEYRKVIQVAATNNITMREAENEALSATHSFVGGKIASAWKFPQEIAETIKIHHNSAKVFPNDGKKHILATFVNVGNCLAKAMMLGTGGDYLVTEIPDAFLSKLGFTNKIPAGFLEELQKDLEYFFDLLKIPKEYRSNMGGDGENKKAVLLMSSGPSPSIFIQLYLVSRNCHILTEKKTGENKEQELSLIVYDFQNGLSEKEQKALLEKAKEHSGLPAIILAGKDTDVGEIEKLHKQVEKPSVPADMFLFEQAVKKFIPDITKKKAEKQDKEGKVEKQEKKDSGDATQAPSDS